jgi:hypothetical protein
MSKVKKVSVTAATLILLNEIRGLFVVGSVIAAYANGTLKLPELSAQAQALIVHAAHAVAVVGA